VTVQPFFLHGENMNRDILTFSRVSELLKNKKNIDNIDYSDKFARSLSMIMIEDDINLLNMICDTINVQATTQIDKVASINTYFEHIANQMELYNNEMESRKEHALTLGIYANPSTEEMAIRAEETKDIYLTNHYFNCYSILVKNGFDSNVLTIYESLMSVEKILCDELNKASLEVCQMIDKGSKSFTDKVRDSIRHANFYSFSVDIYDAVDKVYKEQENNGE